MSCRGGSQIIGQRVQVGLRYAGQIITIEVDETTLHVYDQRDHLIKNVSRTSRKAVRRHKAYGHTTRLVAALIAVCVAAVTGVAITATVGQAPAPQVEAASSVLAPRDPTVSPQARAFLAEIYREGIGPDVLDARGAVLLATGVCGQNRARVGLATLSQNVRGLFPKLSRIQAATLVDDAIKFYCPV